MDISYNKIKDRLSKKIHRNYCFYLSQVMTSRNMSMNRVSDYFDIGRTKLRSYEKGKEETPSLATKEMAGLLASGQMHNPPLNIAQMFDILVGYANEEGKRSPIVEEIARLSAGKPLEQQRQILELVKGNINNFSEVDKRPKADLERFTPKQVREIRLLLEKQGLMGFILQHTNLIAKWLAHDQEGFTYFLQRYRTFKKLRECAKELHSSFSGGADKASFDGKYFRESN